MVELGVWVAGPGAAGILADWGADVVKIEPPGGDPRTFQRMLGGDLDVNPVFELDNRGKRSIALDLSELRGLDVAERPRHRGRLRHQRPTGRARPARPRTRPGARATPSSCTPSSPGTGSTGPTPRAAYDVAAYRARSGIAEALRAWRPPAVPARRHGRSLGRHDGSGDGERCVGGAPGRGGQVVSTRCAKGVHHRLRRHIA